MRSALLSSVALECREFIVVFSLAGKDEVQHSFLYVILPRDLFFLFSLLKQIVLSALI